MDRQVAPTAGSPRPATSTSTNRSSCCRTPGPPPDRDGAPQIVALDFKPDPDKLAHWTDLGVTEVLFGLPDKPEPEVAAYVERLAGKLAALEL